MKINFFLKFLVSGCACLLLAQNLSAYSYSSTIIGDIRIQTLNNGSLYCDSMICPQGSSCHVTKQTDPNNVSVIVRHRKCLAPNGAILQQEIVNEDNPNGIHENINIVSGGGAEVRQMTPEEERELEEYLRQTEEQVRRTQEQVQAQVGNTLNQVYSQLGPLMDGSFARDLSRRINDQVRNSLRF